MVNGFRRRHCGALSSRALRLSGLLACSVIFTTNTTLAELQPIPTASYELLETYCLDCHDDLERKGDISLEALEVDWSDAHSLEIWERAIGALRFGEMPPEKKRQPSDSERATLIAWLDETLEANSPIGGTALRRLNRREYEYSLRSLLDIEYTLPEGFPIDNQAHGFDNQGDALTLSGPLMEAYSKVATDIAEKLFPPVKDPVEPATTRLNGDDFTYAYSSGLVVDGVMRVVASSERFAASAAWPSRFEASVTGIYRVELGLSGFNPPRGESIVCSVHAVNALQAPGEGIDSSRLLAEIDVDSESPTIHILEALLETGETIALRYSNSTLAEDREMLRTHVKTLFLKEPLLASAYMQADGVVERGRIGWERLKQLMQSNLLPEALEGEALDELVNRVIRNLRLTTEVLHYKHFEEGPALEIAGARVVGPIALAEGAEERYWSGKSRALIGDREGRSDETIAVDLFREFLPTAFRRPVSDTMVEEYASIVREEMEATGRLEDGLHLGLRSALTSPYFLYRGFRDGPLDSYDLAARLSFFLTSRPADAKLLRAARDGSLLESDVLRGHAIRLLGSKKSTVFVESFLDQWLDLAALEDLVPDRTLFPKPKEFSYGDVERDSIRMEPNLFFQEMIAANRPLVDFVDPDFTYTNYSIGKHVYELPMEKDGKEQSVRRVALEKGGRFGGVLGMAGVMTATANGVDTQPVVRGVWMLENILGSPPREPPDAVPALTPDTSQAVTPREMLAAHMNESSCAGCHKKIDPIGFVFESFDPIGRWRTHYPDLTGSSKNRSKNGLPVETDGVLPDGTELRDVRDLKAYLARDISPFATCLSEKLLTYATGREMNYSDRKRIAQLVDENVAESEGFRDLLLDLIDSESFRTK